MDNPCCTNMNIPKFFQILYGQFAFSNDSKIRRSRLVRPRLIQISLILSILSFFVVTHQSSINLNCPLFFHPHNSNTKTHRKPVHFFAQSQRQSPRLWTATIPAIFPKGQLKLQSSFIQFWFYIFQFGYGFYQFCSRPQFQYYASFSFSFFFFLSFI